MLVFHKLHLHLPTHLLNTIQIAISIFNDLQLQPFWYSCIKSLANPKVEYLILRHFAKKIECFGGLKRFYIIGWVYDKKIMFSFVARHIGLAVDAGKSWRNVATSFVVSGFDLDLKRRSNVASETSFVDIECLVSRCSFDLIRACNRAPNCRKW